MAGASSSSQLSIQRRAVIAVLVTLLALLVLTSTYLLRPSREELEQQAIDAVARHDLPTAYAALQRISPRDAEVLRFLADLALKLNHRREHLRWLEEAADLGPKPADAYLAAGARAFEWAMPRESERLCRRAIETDSKQLKAYSQLARLYLAWQRGPDMRRVIAAADTVGLRLDEDPLLLWLWVVGDRVHWLEDDSSDWLTQARSEQPEDSFVAAALARALLAKDDAERAKEVLNSFPKDAEGRWPVDLAQAEIDIEANQLTESLRALNAVASQADEHPATWLMRARMWANSGDAEHALLAYEQALRLEPCLVVAHHERGRLSVLQRDSRMSELLQRAARVDELVRRCLQLAQSSQPHVDDLRTVAQLGVGLVDDRWVQHVCRLTERLAPAPNWPEAVEVVKLYDSQPLAVTNLTAEARKLAAWRPASTPSTSKMQSQAAVVTESAIAWSDISNEVGLKFEYEYGHSPQRWLMETLGGGIAVIDLDADGWPDLFFAQGGKLAVGSSRSLPSRVFRNHDGKRLQEVTESVGAIVTTYSHGCAVSDVDHDGFADLLVCHYGGLTLLLNQGDGSWRDVTTAAGLDDDQWNSSAAFSDLDRDGDLDLYVASYCRAPLTKDLKTCRVGERLEPCRPNAYEPSADLVFENLGDGTFANRSDALAATRGSTHSDGGYGLGVIAADFDQDGAAEVFVGNDTTHNFLWANRTNASWSFDDRSLLAGVAVDGTGRAEASMGIACGDMDGDGRLDLFVTTFFDETCTLFQNVGGLQFEDRTKLVGLSNAGQKLMGWGCQFLDADNDGWLDLAVLNGHLHDRPQLPQFYRNLQGRFVEQSQRAGTYFMSPKIGRALATLDFDRDGRMDLIAGHQIEPASLLRNDSQRRNSIILKLIGVQSPRDATGALIKAKIGSRELVRLVSSQGGYLSACATEVLLGIDTAKQIDELEIRWPSGLLQRFKNIASTRDVLIREGSSVLLNSD